MARVAWAALSGDEVETVLSNLFYNWNDRAVRIRPAQGDWGIDVIVPASADPARWDVYQIKKFATNLDSSQKGQVEASFRRILIGVVRKQLPLSDWYVVMPLDPTLDNLTWFNGVPAAAVDALAQDDELALTEAELEQIRAWLEVPGREIAWKGHNFCETLAGDYPYVVDYYLHGGRQRLRDAVADLSALLRTDAALTAQAALTSSTNLQPAALVQPGEIREHLARLGKVLDTDPHFRYGFGIDPTRPDVLPEPNLVAATQENLAGDSWLTFKIYARSRQSLDERPIPLQLEFDFQDSPEDQKAFEIWRKYGKPVRVKGSISADLPGGLQGEPAAGLISLGPAAGEQTEFAIRLRVVDPDGAAMDELPFAMTSTTGLDGTGVWARGTDDSETLDAEYFIDSTTRQAQINFTLKPLFGREASSTTSAVTFASHLTAPNTLQYAGKYGPFHHLAPLDLSEPLADPALARWVQALATIQSVTPTPVQIPDGATMTSAGLALIRRAASLIDGHTFVSNWSALTFEADSDRQLAVGDHCQLAVIEPLRLELNGAQLVLGTAERKLLSARIESIDERSIRAVPHLNDVAHYDFQPEIPPDLDGRLRVRYRPLPPTEDPREGPA